MGPICTVCTCAPDVVVGLLPAEQDALQVLKDKLPSVGGRSEPPQAIARRLLGRVALLLLVFVPWVIYLIPVAFVFESSLMGDLVVTTLTFLILLFVWILILDAFNQALEATGSKHIVAQILCMTFVPFYWIIMLFVLVGRLRRDPSPAVTYGRWNVV